MSIQIRAFLYALGIFAAIGVGSLALVEIMNLIPQEYYFGITITALVLMGFYLVYSVCKAQLEYKARLEQIVNQK